MCHRPHATARAFFLPSLVKFGAVTLVGAARVSRSLTPSCPYAFQPQVTRSPNEVTHAVCLAPHETAETDVHGAALARSTASTRLSSSHENSTSAGVAVAAPSAHALGGTPSCPSWFDPNA